MFDNSAWDVTGHRIRDVVVVMTMRGTSPHLAFAGGGHGSTFCGLPAVVRLPAPWFRISGCLRCVKAASTQSVARITDVDGVMVGLPEREEVED